MKSGLAYPKWQVLEKEKGHLFFSFVIFVPIITLYCMANMANTKLTNIMWLRRKKYPCRNSSMKSGNSFQNKNRTVKGMRGWKIEKIVREDPADDKFIACAVALKAKVIISGDKRLKAIKDYMGIKILDPSESLSFFRR